MWTVRKMESLLLQNNRIKALICLDVESSISESSESGTWQLFVIFSGVFGGKGKTAKGNSVWSKEIERASDIVMQRSVKHYHRKVTDAEMKELKSIEKMDWIGGSQ